MRPLSQLLCHSHALFRQLVQHLLLKRRSLHQFIDNVGIARTLILRVRVLHCTRYVVSTSLSWRLAPFDAFRVRRSRVAAAVIKTTIQPAPAWSFGIQRGCSASLALGSRSVR